MILDEKKNALYEEGSLQSQKRKLEFYLEWFIEMFCGQFKILYENLNPDIFPYIYSVENTKNYFVRHFSKGEISCGFELLIIHSLRRVQI